jgi:inosine-uridine nucleoside N-ribohydrolase
MSTRTSSTNLMIGAAAIAGLSVYWIVAAYRKPSKEDIDFLLAKVAELQQRLDELEKGEEDKKIISLGRKDSPPQWMSKSSSLMHRRQVRQGDESIKDDDSDANVLPPPYEEEDSVFAPPQIITTKPREDKATQFLKGQDSISHHSITAQASTTSTSIDRAPVPIVLISDPGQDLDDEMMFIMARHLVDLKLISLEGVIANLSPSFARARLTRGTLDLLGLHRVPVGIGSDGGDLLGTHKSDQFESTASSYIINENGEAARSLESGFRLLHRLYDAAPDVEYVDVDRVDIQDEIAGVQEFSKLKYEDRDNGRGNIKIQHENSTTSKKIVKGGLTIVITSSMKDIAIFVRESPTLFASKTREVVVMGGCKPVHITNPKTGLTTDDTSVLQSSSQNSSLNVWETLSNIECEPDAANNNSFDPAASAFFYSQCQKMNITLTVVSRFAAYSAKMPRSVYDDLALTGSSIGWRLRNSQRCSIDQLWRRACSLDPEIRQGLPLRCDRKWFINTFCGGVDDQSRCSADTAWDLVTGFMQYDTIALFAAVPAIREQFFDPFVMPPLQPAKRQDSDGIKDEFLSGDPSYVSERRLSGESISSHFFSFSSGVKLRRRRSTYPGPPAMARAIARARKDSELIETPFQSPVSSIPEAFDRGTRNLIGISDEVHNINDPTLLINLLKTGYRQGILCDHFPQSHIILHLQLRWDNLADTLLMCLMLRSKCNFDGF